VRADTPAMHLINFLASESGSEASKTSTEVQNTRAKEEALLEHVRQVRVVCVCVCAPVCVPRMLSACVYVYVSVCVCQKG